MEIAGWSRARGLRSTRGPVASSNAASGTSLSSPHDRREWCGSDGGRSTGCAQVANSLCEGDQPRMDEPFAARVARVYERGLVGAFSPEARSVRVTVALRSAAVCFTWNRGGAMKVAEHSLADRGRWWALRSLELGMSQMEVEPMGWRPDGGSTRSVRGVCSEHVGERDADRRPTGVAGAICVTSVAPRSAAACFTWEPRTARRRSRNIRGSGADGGR